MCEKGRRCKYADEMSVLRRKHRRRQPNIAQRDLRKLIDKELEQRPELAYHLAIQNKGFQWDPPSWSVPYSLTKKMHSLGSMPESYPEAKKLYEIRQAWESNLTREEDNALRNYAMTGYISINGHLRNSKNRYEEFNLDTKEQQDKRAKERIKHLDSALSKAPNFDDPVPVYRYYKVPAGVEAEEYMKNILAESGGHKDKAFVSTTTNPYHALAAIYKHNRNEGMHGYVMMEIWTTKAASMQTRDYSVNGDIQSQEHEILIPRNTGLRVLETGKMRHTFDEVPVELESFSRTYDTTGIVGKRLSVPLIRLIDEQIVRDERNSIKERA